MLKEKYNGEILSIGFLLNLKFKHEISDEVFEELAEIVKNSDPLYIFTK